MKKVYRLEDLDCANCAAKMERAISKIEGVQSASVSFLMQRLARRGGRGALRGDHGARRKGLPQGGTGLPHRALKEEV